MRKLPESCDESSAASADHQPHSFVEPAFVIRKLALHLHPEADGVQHQVVFQAPPQWALVRLRLSDFKPTRRGRSLPMADVLSTDHIHQLGLLTTERVAGGFMLGLRAIWLV